MWLSAPNTRELSAAMGTICRDSGKRRGCATASRHVYERAAAAAMD
jgi:hypothetical protein